MAVIFLAEDNELIRENLAAILSEAGHEVHQADNGGGVLSALKAFSPDLVLTDVFMPEMDGIELIRVLAEQNPHLPIIAMTGGGKYQAPALATRLATTTGATRVLEKPISNTQLLEEVSRLLHRFS